MTCCCTVSIQFFHGHLGFTLFDFFSTFVYKLRVAYLHILQLIPITTSTLHPFNGFYSRTAWVSRHQEGKPFWTLMKQEMRWQWHQLDHMEITCTLLQTDNHACTSPLSYYRLGALPATQPIASKH